jgi:hypothetical protein
MSSWIVRCGPPAIASHEPKTVVAEAFVSGLAVWGCSNGPTAPNCQNVAGTNHGAFNYSCGASGSGTVVVAQSGCNFTAAISDGTVTGTINGSTAMFTIAFSPCGGTATGTATVSSTAVNGTYQGRAIGSGCCDPVSGSFTLTR